MKTRKQLLYAYGFLGSIITILLLLLLRFTWLFPGEKPPERESPGEGVTEKPPEEKPPSKGDIYIIIDDVGYGLKELEPFLKLDIPMTFAVLPRLRYTVEAARTLHDQGKQVILHQPMEPLGDENPGEGAVYTGMKPEEIRRVLDENLKENPFAVGMNNHMGSKVTSDPEAMKVILGFAKEKKLYYLDSYTTGSSVGKAVADTVKLRFTWRNSMFLDNDRHRESILEALRAGLETAEKRGHAVMIGHIMSNELAEILLEIYPELLEEGYSFKELSSLFTENFIDDDPGY
ncbi:MAG: divergent polysaccharide deacetylase family protein [Spirochaetales bacterium]|nr:divergent polysaccharide deacetylase family protein [Spirochaetales bacterium]